MWNEEVHWSGRFHVCSVDSYWYLIWILYRKLDFNLLLLKVVYCQTRTDLYRGFLRHLKSLSDTCLKIFKNGKTQVPLFLHDVKTHDKNVSLCDNIPNRSQLFLLTLELSLISKTCSLSIQCMKTLWTSCTVSGVHFNNSMTCGSVISHSHFRNKFEYLKSIHASNLTMDRIWRFKKKMIYGWWKKIDP